MIYIDFDGVILDTEDLLFEDWRKIPNHKNLSEEEKIKYIQNIDWNFIINNSDAINDSIYYLHESDPNKTTILTKVHSLDNEGKAKNEWKRRNNIKQPIILVPYYYKKTEFVDAKDNILYDDCLRNLDDWICSGGFPVFFDKDNDGYDSWNQPNTKGYQKVMSLKDINRS